MRILAIDLAKAKSLFCWFDSVDQSHRFGTVFSTPKAFHDALVAEAVDRVVIEVCDTAGWVQDLCQTLSIPIQVVKPMDRCSKRELWCGHLWMELEQLDELEEQIALLDRKLDELGDAEANVRRLRTIPGVGPRLSELVVAVLDDPKRFKNARQVGAYAGLVPRRYQSGQMDRSGRISKAGCGKLRKLLLEIAWGMLRHNPHGQKVFARISKGQKTRRKQAAVALARRVLVWCWAMLRDGTDWQTPKRTAARTATATATTMQVT